MRISRKELAAMSPPERKAVLDRMAHPAAAARPPRDEPARKASVFAPLVQFLQNLLPTGRASR